MTIHAPQLVNVLNHGAVGDEQADDTAALQAAVNAAGPGGTVYVGPGVRLRITSPVTISHDQVTITGGGRINTDTTSDAIVITAHDVTLRDLTIKGPGHGATYVKNTALIKIKGSASAPAHRLTLDGLTIFSAPASAVWAEHTVQTVVRDCRIRNVRYAGVMLVSATDALIEGNFVDGVHMDANVVNGYGLVCTDISNDDAGRSRHVTITNNIVRNNPTWTGIDTHSGDSIIITGNQTINCANGIAALPGNRQRTHGPTNILIAHNLITRGSAPDINAGITLAGNTADITATGTVTSNRVIGYSEPYRHYHTGWPTLRVNNAIV